MAKIIKNGRLQQKIDTEENWNSNNPTILAGEICVATNINGEVNKKVKIKIANVDSPWDQVSYLNTGDGGGGVTIKHYDDYESLPTGQNTGAIGIVDSDTVLNFGETILYPKGTFRLPSAAEYTYLLDTREDAHDRRFRATITDAIEGGLKGLIILPDSYDLSKLPNYSSDAYGKLMTKTNFESLEKKGAYFLFNAGNFYVDGAPARIIEVWDFNNGGWYWTSSFYGGVGRSFCNYDYRAGVPTISGVDDWYTFRPLAVRLLQECKQDDLGAISIAEGKYAKFAKGNLQYEVSDGTWYFAKHQYDALGTSQIESVTSGNGKIDLFSFGASGYNDRDPLHPSSLNTDIAGTDYDWGLYCDINLEVDDIRVFKAGSAFMYNEDTMKWEPISGYETPKELELQDRVDALEAGKVDKEEGKGLSQENYTTEEKAKLASITTPMQMKGRVDEVEDLPESGVKVGDVYLVGLEGSENFEEYVCTEVDASTDTPTWEGLGPATFTQKQVDWNENDDTKEEYIKNRTHYDEGDEIIEKKIPFNLTYASTVRNYTYNDKTYYRLTMENANQIKDGDVVDFHLLGEDENDNPVEIIMENNVIKFGEHIVIEGREFDIFYFGFDEYFSLLDPSSEERTLDYITTGEGGSSAGYVVIGDTEREIMTYYTYSGFETPYSRLYITDPHAGEIHRSEIIKHIKKLDIKYLPDGGVGYESDAPVDLTEWSDFVYEDDDLTYKFKFKSVPDDFVMNFTGIMVETLYSGESREQVTQLVFSEDNKFKQTLSDAHFEGWMIQESGNVGLVHAWGEIEYYVPMFSQGPGLYMLCEIRNNEEISLTNEFQDLVYAEIHKIDKKFIPKITKDVIFEKADEGFITDFDPSSYIMDDPSIKSISIPAIPKKIINGQLFNSYDSGFNFARNPGFPHPCEAMLWYNDTLYGVGGDNDLNVYKFEWDENLELTKTSIVQLDSTHFTSTYALTCDNNGDCIVVGMSDGAAIFNLNNEEPEVEYAVWENDKVNYRGVAMIDKDHFTALTGLTRTNGYAYCHTIYKVSTGEQQYEYQIKASIVPLHCGNIYALDGSFYLGVQYVLGLGYGYGLAKLKVYDADDGFIDNPEWRLVSQRSDNSNWAHMSYISKFSDNFPITELRNAYYSFSQCGYGGLLSFDGGDTWEQWKLWDDCCGFREDGFSVTFDGYLYKITGCNFEAKEITGMRISHISYTYTFFVPGNNDLIYQIYRYDSTDNNMQILDLSNYFELTDGIHMYYPEQGGGGLTPLIAEIPLYVSESTDDDDNYVVYKITKVPGYDTYDIQSMTTMILFENDRNIWKIEALLPTYQGWMIRPYLLTSTPVILLATDEEINEICQ